jgi:predicted metallo-beta-lactamase superfamily hydrolase
MPRYNLNPFQANLIPLYEIVKNSKIYASVAAFGGVTISHYDYKKFLRILCNPQLSLMN